MVQQHCGEDSFDYALLEVADKNAQRKNTNQVLTGVRLFYRILFCVNFKLMLTVRAGYANGPFVFRYTQPCLTVGAIIYGVVYETIKLCKI